MTVPFLANVYLKASTSSVVQHLPNEASNIFRSFNRTKNSGSFGILKKKMYLMGRVRQVNQGGKVNIHHKKLPGHFELLFGAHHQFVGNTPRWCIHEDVLIQHVHVLRKEVPTNHCTPIVSHQGELFTSCKKRIYFVSMGPK